VPWTRIESGAYWLVFVAAFLGVAIWESYRPRRSLCVSTGRRWRNHGLLLVVCTVLSVGLYRISPVIVAASAVGSRFGLLNKLWLPFAARCILAVLVLDLTKYLLHRACHSQGLLWRLHQVHHSDPDFDVSTAFRVHPIELIFTQFGYFAAIAIVAPPPVAVLITELASTFQSFFGHANARLPEWLEKLVRAVFYTPDMHRIHHSEEIREQNCNLGDIFPWWDRLLGTYESVPAAGQAQMITGLKGFQTPGSLSFGFMIRIPFLPDRPENTSPDVTIAAEKLEAPAEARLQLPLLLAAASDHQQRPRKQDQSPN
jgi:sterol desaturase/sphingolipid hydroxylase (fatty acid hydroxylase superfamily)